MKNFSKFLSLIGLLIPEDKKAQFDQIVKQAQSDEGEDDVEIPDAGDAKHNSALIQQLQTVAKRQQATIDQLTTEIAERNKRDAAREEEQKSRATKELDANVDKEIAAAVADGRIPSENKELQDSYRDTLKANFDTGKKIIDGLPKNPAVVKGDGKDGGKDSGKDKGTGQDTNTAAGGGAFNRAALMESAANAFSSN